jgi:hypothetical protein
MEIQESFTTEAIEQMDTTVTEEEEEQLKAIIRQAFSDIEVSHTDQIVDLCAFVFVAGRTHHAGNVTIPISMSPALASRFMEFLNT